MDLMHLTLQTMATADPKQYRTMRADGSLMATARRVASQGQALLSEQAIKEMAGPHEYAAAKERATEIVKTEAMAVMAEGARAALSPEIMPLTPEA